jgi:hypothetical protein
MATVEEGGNRDSSSLLVLPAPVIICSQPDSIVTKGRTFLHPSRAAPAYAGAEEEVSLWPISATSSCASRARWSSS